MTKDKADCKARWRTSKNGRLKDLRKLLEAYNAGDEDRHSQELGTLYEYGLSFDFVAPETFTDQAEGYWRYQLSWGGPSDEFRFYASGCGELKPYRISYVFLDWFDGHERSLKGSDLAVLRDIWEFFADCGSTQEEYRKATGVEG